MPHTDWLLDPAPFTARIDTDPARPERLALDNGLIRREFLLDPAGGVSASIALDNPATGERLLRSVRPEAELTIDGTAHAVGGLTGQPLHNFLLPAWLDDGTMAPDPAAFALESVEQGRTREPFPWQPRQEWLSTAAPVQWPAPGVSLRLRHRAPAGSGLDGLTVDVHYELYDGIPLISKWLTLHNGTGRTVTLDRFTAERLALASPSATSTYAEDSESPVEQRALAQLQPLHVQTDMAFGGYMDAVWDNPAVHWGDDPLTRETGVHLDRALLTVRPPLGPAAQLAGGDSFTSFRTYELLHSEGEDRERRGLAVRRTMRTIAPWVQENPLILHLRTVDPEAVRQGIEQAAEAGFEMVILSFGSGLDMEDVSPENLATLRQLADHAHTKGIALGGYSLLASRRISDADDVIDPTTRKPDRHARFLASPCLGSTWGQEYFTRLERFLTETGFDNLEHDGSYPGDVCASTGHPGHRGLADSQWTQWERTAELYRWARGRGMYLTVPDWYFTAGSNKTGMGYVENNWSLPRHLQEIVERQNIFDGTWEKTPSMGWMHVPLEEYHGGGPAATLEPLSEHLPDYRRRLANLLGGGVTGVFRGSRLFDTDETKTLVREWVGRYRRHRALLDADVIHLRRADGRDLDYLLHADARLADGGGASGLLAVFNPLDEPVERELEIPLYYTGIRGRVEIAEVTANPEQPVRTAELDQAHRLRLPIRVPAHDTVWLTFTQDRKQGEATSGPQNGTMLPNLTDSGESRYL